MNTQQRTYYRIPHTENTDARAGTNPPARAPHVANTDNCTGASLPTRTSRVANYDTGTTARAVRAHTARTSVVEPLALIALPAVLIACAILQPPASALITLTAAIFTLVVFAICFERSRPSLAHIMPIVVMSTLAVAGRILFVFTPNIKPVSAICVIAGAVFGKRSGFMTGALAALVSNFFFGQGAWTPWQMYAWGLLGYVAGVLGEHGIFDEKPVDCQSPTSKHPNPALYIYGFLASIFYGAILNTWFLIGFVHPITPAATVLTYGAGLAGDVTHAVSTVAFLSLMYAPWRKKIVRIKRKFAL